MGGRDRSGLALAVLALVTLAGTDLPWLRGQTSLWGTALGIAVGLLATALLVCESLPLLRLGRERALLGGALGLGVAASIGLLVGFELANLDFFGGRTFWIGSWVGIVLAVLLALAGVLRLGGLSRERRDPEWLGALVACGAGLAFASTFMPWATAAHHVGGPSADAWAVAGAAAVAFGLAALAVVGAEALRIAGLRPLLPATVVLAALTAIFGVLSVISLARQLGKYAVLGRGAWLALAACAALIVGAVLRRRELRLD